MAHFPRKYIHGRCGPAVTSAEIVYQNEFELIRQTHGDSPAVTWAESDVIWFAK